MTTEEKAQTFKIQLTNIMSNMFNCEFVMISFMRRILQKYSRDHKG